MSALAAVGEAWAGGLLAFGTLLAAGLYAKRRLAASLRKGRR